MIFSQKNVTVKNVHLITKPFMINIYIYMFIIYTLMFVYMFDIYYRYIKNINICIHQEKEGRFVK